MAAGCSWPDTPFQTGERAWWAPRTHATAEIGLPSQPMRQPFTLAIGLRYTRSRRRSGFVSFITLISVVGIALGITTLIVVLSVMNGFQTEVRERILGMASHATITKPDGPVDRVNSTPSSGPRSRPFCASRLVTTSRWSRPRPRSVWLASRRA